MGVMIKKMGAKFKFKSFFATFAMLRLGAFAAICLVNGMGAEAEADTEVPRSCGTFNPSIQERKYQQS